MDTITSELTLMCRFLNTTRLYSSRMHTARSLTVSPSMLCPWGVPGPRGGACLVLGGAWSGGGAWSQGGCLPGPRMVPGPGRVVSQHALRQTPPVNRITDACENITLPQLRCGR